MSSVPNFYTIHMLQNLMCVQERIQLGAGGSTVWSDEGWCRSTSKNFIYFQPWTKGFVCLCLWQFSVPMCYFSLPGLTTEKKRSLHVVAVHMSPGIRHMSWKAAVLVYTKHAQVYAHKKYTHDLKMHQEFLVLQYCTYQCLNGMCFTYSWFYTCPFTVRGHKRLFIYLLYLCIQVIFIQFNIDSPTFLLIVNSFLIMFWLVQLLSCFSMF